MHGPCPTSDADIMRGTREIRCGGYTRSVAVGATLRAGATRLGLQLAPPAAHLWPFRVRVAPSPSPDLLLPPMTITRRDLLKGTALAAGGSLVSALGFDLKPA